MALYAWRRDPLLPAAAVAGAVLPDLIDKPLGLLITGSGGFGRIYAHTLLFFLLLISAGCLSRGMYSRRVGTLVLSAAAGVLSHQLLDVLWLLPVTWYWPLLGPFPLPEEAVPFLSYLLADILQPAEWLFFAASLFIAATLAGMRGGWQRLAPALSLVLAFFAMGVLFSAVTGSPSAITGWDDRGDNAIVAFMLLAGAVGVDRAGARAG